MCGQAGAQACLGIGRVNWKFLARGPASFHDEQASSTPQTSTRLVAECFVLESVAPPPPTPGAAWQSRALRPSGQRISGMEHLVTCSWTPEICQKCAELKVMWAATCRRPVTSVSPSAHSAAACSSPLEVRPVHKSLEMLLFVLDTSSGHRIRPATASGRVTCAARDLSSRTRAETHFEGCLDLNWGHSRT